MFLLNSQKDKYERSAIKDENRHVHTKTKEETRQLSIKNLISIMALEIMRLGKKKHVHSHRVQLLF